MNYLINNNSTQRRNTVCNEPSNTFFNSKEPKDLYNDLFQTFFNTESPEKKTWIAPLNLKETKDSITVTAEIPGIEKDKIEIEYHDGVLKISGNKEDSFSNENDNYIHKEITFGKFSRSIQVGDIAFEKSIADISNGVLSIQLPKSEEKKAKTLKIN
jgi:HSP20 family protein